MRPERPGQIGPAADVWGLGATLYHAVSGPTGRSRPALGTRSDARGALPAARRGRAALGDACPGRCGTMLAASSSDPAARPAPRSWPVSLQPLVAALPAKLVLGRRRRRAEREFCARRVFQRT